MAKSTMNGTSLGTGARPVPRPVAPPSALGKVPGVFQCADCNLLMDVAEVLAPPIYTERADLTAAAVAEAVKRYAGDRKRIAVFCQTRKHAEEVAQIFGEGEAA